MKIVLAPDSFKGSLTSLNAAKAMERGVRRVAPNALIVTMPIADGGEGTLDAVLWSCGGERVSCRVTGPLGKPVSAAYGLLPGGETAVVEMALAAGLGLVVKCDRDPCKTTSYGVGELLLAAAHSGVSEIIVGVGGSCTNDGGTGMLQALNVAFYGVHGDLIRAPICGGDLESLSRIDFDPLVRDFQNLKITVASDVTNPLLGANGATRVFGPQKGATLKMVEILESGMMNFVRIVRDELNSPYGELPGDGAAGGLGGAVSTFLNAKIKSGIDLILELARFEEKAVDADFVLTGEGKIDLQTLSGKAIFGILTRCQTLGVPVIAFAGNVDKDAARQLVGMGLAAASPIADRPMTISESVANAASLLEEAVARTMLHFAPRSIL